MGVIVYIKLHHVLILNVSFKHVKTLRVKGKVSVNVDTVLIFVIQVFDNEGDKRVL